MRILGLDPGSQATGFGIIDWAEGDARYVASGAIRTSGASFPPRLRQIYEGVSALSALRCMNTRSIATSPGVYSRISAVTPS